MEKQKRMMNQFPMKKMRKRTHHSHKTSWRKCSEKRRRENTGTVRDRRRRRETNSD
jgi:hypothetical protein